MFSQTLFLLVKKWKLFYSISFCLPKSITNSYNFASLIFLASVAGNFLLVTGNFIHDFHNGGTLGRNGNY